jgi:hypothetical protein
MLEMDSHAFAHLGYMRSLNKNTVCWAEFSLRSKSVFGHLREFGLHNLTGGGERHIRNEKNL